MNRLTKKLSSILLAVSLLCTSSIPTLATTNNTPEKFHIEGTTYVTCNQADTEYGTIFYVEKQTDDAEISPYTLWDCVDIIMAGASWSTLFQNPSWANFGWAVLDTAALLPLLPSTAYFRQGGKYILKADEVAKFAKTAKGKTAIEAAMKTFKYSDGISSKAIKAITKKYKGPEGETIIAMFKQAADKGLVGATGSTGIKKLTGTYNKIYTHEIKLLGKYGDLRIFGYQASNGEWIFDLFVNGAH